MFHIVFNATEDYLAYAAVLMTSIIEQAQKKIEQKTITEPEFTFHIITDKISASYRDKIKNFEQELSKVTPTNILIHTMSGNIFSGLKNYGSKIIYFRLNLEAFLSADIDRCLYLDVDMIALDDIRPLFSLDLQDKLGAVVCDMGSKKHKLKAKNKTNKDIDLGPFYFNSGFLLLNLKQWRSDKVTERCFQLIKDYNPHTPDQDILNAVMPASRIQILPFAWNFVTNAFCFVLCKDEQSGYLPYSRKDFNESKNHPRILHYSLKPWDSLRNGTDAQNKDVGQYWWQYAMRTPIFQDELQARRRYLEKHPLLMAAIGYETWKRLQKWYGTILVPFLLSSSSDQKYLSQITTIPNHLFGISCLLGEAVLHARKYKHKAINLIVKTLKIRQKFLHYGNR